jgi:signal transduction histidine kinase
MRATAWLRSHPVEALWAAFAAINWASMVLWPSWETIPFHFVWISLTIVYGFRTWRTRAMLGVLGAVVVATGASILLDTFEGLQLWGELFEVPLMSAMFLAMVWHAQRRRTAVERVVQMLAGQEQFLEDVAHELRTPVTIARGHLELLRVQSWTSAEVSVALDELDRLERIVDRLLLLAKAGQPEAMQPGPVDVEWFLDDLFMRWSEIGPRVWRLGSVTQGTLHADEEALRAALDALIENAVKHTDAHEEIELSAIALGGDLLVQVADEGPGIPPEALARIFDRFGRADDARTRTTGGVGLGLAIVAAVAAAHEGTVRVIPREPRGVTFALRLPGFVPTGSPFGLPVATRSRVVG